MIKIEARALMEGVIVNVECYHGWGDRTGHPVHQEFVDVDGDDQQQLIVAIEDVLNHMTKDRSLDLCPLSDQGVLNLG